MEHLIVQWVQQHGYPAIFVLLMFGIVGLPVPDETLLTFTGYLVYKGHLHLPLAFLAAFAGSACGITVSYMLGRTFGVALIHRYGRYIHFTEERVARAHDWFERAGRWGLTFGYYIPGVRHLTAYAAGMSGLEAPVFALFAWTGAFLWCTSFITLGYFLGERWASASADVHRYILWGCVAAALLGGAVLLWRRLKQRHYG